MVLSVADPVRCRHCGTVVQPPTVTVVHPPTEEVGDLSATQVCTLSPQDLLSATQKATPQIPAPVAAALRLLNPKTLSLTEPERRKRLADNYRELCEYIERYRELPPRQWDVGWAYAVRARVLVALGRKDEIFGDLLEAFARKADLSPQEMLELTRACITRRIEGGAPLALYRKFLPYLLEHAGEFPGGESGVWEFLVRLAADAAGPDQAERAELCSGLLECRPDSAVSHFLVGLRLHEGRRQQEALGLLRRAEEQMQEDRTLPTSWKGRITQTLGRIQVALGRHEEARNAFERSLSHDPDQYEAYRDYVLLEVHLLLKVPVEELAHPRHRARLERARRNLDAAEKNLQRQAVALGSDTVVSQRRKLSKAGNEIERMLGGV